MTDKCGTDEPWQVRNDIAISGGPMSLREGVAKSVNPFFAALNVKLGACSVRDTMLKMGLHRADGKAISDTIAGIALGAGESTPMSVASAYATLAANGKYCEPSPSPRSPPPTTRPSRSPAPSASRSSRPTSPPASTTCSRASSRTAPSSPLWDSDARPAAGKTGTTEKHNQIWFPASPPARHRRVGRQPQAGEQERQALHPAGKCFGEYGCVRRVYGSTVAAPIWSKIMGPRRKGMPVKDFREPSAKIRKGN